MKCHREKKNKLMKRKERLNKMNEKISCREKKVPLIALTMLLAVALVGGILAYWNQTSVIENPFDTGRYGSTVKEDFSPADGNNWQPGVDVNKDVYAVNTGETDLIVRARLDEKWTRMTGDGITEPGVKYKDSLTDSYDVYLTDQKNPTDGLTTLDGSVVVKKFSGSTNWIDGEDGWYYYAINLEGGKTSDKWLDSVELLAEADMGKMLTKRYVSYTDDTDETTWVWFEYTGEMPMYIIENTGIPCEKDDVGAQKVRHNKVETAFEANEGSVLYGYSLSNYTLTVTVETVQATKEAVDAMFAGESTFTPPAGTTWKLKG